ncbi:MAG: RecQ family ATP-dependent DNA helicase [Salinivirgaceae bacterium]|nr:RecQ family ATP-dependent DNA helicase [Salinivirgaceae bacterium]
MSKYTDILEKYWGYKSFRPLQEEIITSVGEGRDTLALMPTGGGKSITFQVPALALSGVCVVVTPLIALMKDQVENLRSHGIKAYAIYTGMSSWEIKIALENCANDPDTKFLYCSPERLSSSAFRDHLKRMQVNLLAIDEAHCISQWGYDFRPHYLQIAQIRKLIPDAPVLAVTATATPLVVDDIQKQLDFKQKNVFRKSFERPNLTYMVRQTEDKPQYVLKIINSIPGTGIVYARSRNRTKEYADFLCQNGISADFYHAGLSPEERDLKQTQWKLGNTRVIVATNAFGMGIDKPDVRFVIHVDLPDSLEAYFQEAGRGGRDEKRAYAVMLYQNRDSSKLSQRVDHNYPDLQTVREVYNKVCDYLQVPIEWGKDRSFDFNLADFVQKFHVEPNIALGSLSILQQAGYLEFDADPKNSSRIMFIVDRDDLYNYQSVNADEEDFIRVLLRSYTGLFSEYRPIDEAQLAKNMKKENIGRQQIYEFLKKLAHDRIIDYIPQKKLPQIYFTEERLATEALYFPPSIYLDRKKLFVEKINAVVKYATADRCRVQMLLEYFGMSNVRPCGTCDHCLRKNFLDISNAQFETMLMDIRQSLADSKKTITDLVDGLNHNPDTLLRVIRWMMDNKQLSQNADNLLFLNK